MTCQICEVILELLLGDRYNRGWCLKVRAVGFSFSKNLPVIDNLCKMLRLSPAPSKELSEKEGSVDVVEATLHREMELLITILSSSTMKKECEDC